MSEKVSMNKFLAREKKSKRYLPQCRASLLRVSCSPSAQIPTAPPLDNGRSTRYCEPLDERIRRWEALPVISRITRLLLPLILCSVTVAFAQQPPVNSPLLDHLVGKWVLQGTIAGQNTTHDVNAEWVLDHHYLQIHEVSREKNSKGDPQYQATIYIGWNETTKDYACVWLDDFGGLATESIGVASAKENELPFVFKDEKGGVTFKNEFVYDAKANTWEWHMDNVANGIAKPFGRVKLTRD
jgi:hypothetical protein